VDLDEGCIRLDGAHSKNGKPLTAYLSPETTPRLAEHRADVAKVLGAVGPCVLSTRPRGRSGASGCRSSTRRGGLPRARRGTLVSCCMIFVAQGCAQW